MDEQEAFSPVSQSLIQQLTQEVVRNLANLESSAGNAAVNHLKGRGLSDETIKQFKIGLSDEMSIGYPGHISIPYLDHTEQSVLTIRYRRVAGDGPKYRSLSGDPPRIFNVAALARKPQQVHVAEGEFDAMILHQCGLEAVALPGASTWSPRIKRAMRSAPEVYIWADGDKAGNELATKILRDLRFAKRVSLPPGMDVTDVYNESGPEEILRMKREA